MLNLFVLRPSNSSRISQIRVTARWQIGWRAQCKLPHAAMTQPRTRCVWLTSAKNDARGAGFLFHTRERSCKSLTGSGAREKLSIRYYARGAGGAERLPSSLLNARGCRAQWQFKLIITTLRMIDATYLMRTVRSRARRSSPDPRQLILSHRRPCLTRIDPNLRARQKRDRNTGRHLAADSIYWCWLFGIYIPSTSFFCGENGSFMLQKS
jgi:hypothetical protein